MLSGEGADEFFAGYRIYQTPFSNAKLNWVPKPLLRGASKLARNLGIRGANYLERASETAEDWYYTNANGVAFTPAERERLRKGKRAADAEIPPTPQQLTAPYYAEVASLDETARMQYVDLYFWLVGDILLKTDKMSMAHSLESRVPFLDKELIEFAFSLTQQECNPKGELKGLLKYAYKDELPLKLLNRKKTGFSIPYNYVQGDGCPQEILLKKLWDI